ncbi:30S ribosomal protein S11 [Candidatus Phytoplasma sacchari]|uniref:Small ribosomal subunit protein uS11 n=1 Tax=Candidatus Phytoplasma sacchari TaxID=2609813 RepID=A0ABY7M477_9MOLU|nr:30S ribosomal protein S11 [Candidatus Phytoplasma sacchari]
MNLKKKTKRNKKNKKNILSGIAHIYSTFNNTIINITDLIGNTIAWKSAGCLGFKGSRKSTSFAAQQVAKEVSNLVKEQGGMIKIEIFVKGAGPGRDTSIRALQESGLEITAINDVTPIPHNGCRPPKRPRS